MFPLIDYSKRYSTPLDVGPSRRTVQVVKDGQTIDMDWDSPDPPTKSDVMAWVNRTMPVQAPSPTRQQPIKVDLNKAFAPGAAAQIDTTTPPWRMPTELPPVPEPEPTGFDLSRITSRAAANKIDTTVAPERPKAKVTTPLHVMGATGAATGRAMGSLMDKPGNVIDALAEGYKGGSEAFMGGHVTSPSEQIEQRVGKPMGGLESFIADTVLDIGNVADPIQGLSHLGMIGAVKGTDDIIKALAKKGLKSLETRAAEDAARAAAARTVEHIAPGERTFADLARESASTNPRYGLGDVRAPEPHQPSLMGEPPVRPEPPVQVGPPPPMGEPKPGQQTLGFDPVKPTVPHPPEPKQMLLTDLIPGLDKLPPEIQEAAMKAHKLVIENQPKASGAFGKTAADVAKGSDAIIRSAGKTGPKLERLLKKTRLDADLLAGQWSVRAEEATKGFSKSEMADYIKARDTGVIPNDPKIQEALAKRAELDKEIQGHLTATGAGLDASGKPLPIIEKEGQWPRIYEDKFFNNKDKAIQTMIESGMTPEDAKKAYQTSGRYGQRLIHPQGGQLTIPGYRTDIGADLKHIHDTAKRVVEARNFGPQDIGDPNSAISRLIAGTNDPKRIEDIVRRHLGKETPSRQIKHLNAVVQGAVKMQTAMHLSNFAIGNFTQQAAIGLRGNMKSYAKALGKTIFDYKNAVGEASATGALQSMQQDILRDAGGEWWVSKMFGLKRSETFNRTVSALTGKMTAEDLVKQLQKNPANKRARARLENLLLEDINPVIKSGELSENQIGRAGGRMAEITQGRAQSLDLPPLWSDHPALSIPLLFKKYAFRQTKIIKEAILENPRRNIPLALGLYTAMGELAGDARSGIKGAASGEGSMNAIAARGQGLDRIASNLGQSWAFGILTAMLDAARHGSTGILKEISGPIIGDTARTVGDVFTGNKRDLAKQGLGMVPWVGSGLAQREDLLPGEGKKSSSSSTGERSTGLTRRRPSSRKLTR